MARKRDIESSSLSEALVAIRAGDLSALQAALGSVPRLDATRLRGTSWTGGYYLIRGVLTRFRDEKLSGKQAIAMADLLLDHGATKKSLHSAFEDLFVNVVGLPEISADMFMLVNWLLSQSRDIPLVVSRWADETLGHVLKTWDTNKWESTQGSLFPVMPEWEGMLGDMDCSMPDLQLPHEVVSPAVVRALMKFGAGRNSRPPAWHRSRETAGHYAIGLGDPRISTILFRTQQSSKGTARGRREKSRTVYGATEAEKIRVIQACEEAGEEIDLNVTAERLDDLIGPRFLPRLRRLGIRDPDRTRSMLGGVPFTSARFPWPGPPEAPFAPIIQLDLNKASGVIGAPLGDGLLQVWRSIEQSTSGSDPFSALLTMIVPSRSVKQTKKLTPVPEIVRECRWDPSYSWKEAPLGAPRYIEDWRPAGFAIPDLENLNGFVPDGELALSRRVQRPDLGAAMPFCPVIYGPYYDLPSTWLPLVTVYGPLHGCQAASFPEDRVEVYFRVDKAGSAAFKAAWLNEFIYP